MILEAWKHQIPESNMYGFETFAVIIPTVFYTLITVFIESYFQMNKNTCFLLEIFTILTPQILGYTKFANYSGEILYILFTICTLLVAWCLGRSKLEKNNSFDTKFITNHRACVNILSVIAILAVDFNIFPYRFEKTETFGYSVMDTGVGLYVFANGIVSPESREVKNPIIKSVKGSAILLIIGVGRFLLTKLFHYHVPESEYGVHWNFFITLGITKILTSFCLNVFNIRYIFINAVVLLLSHEMLLQSGLEKFVFEDIPRDNFIKANKEGLVSSLGFVILYLFSVYFGYVIQLKKKQQTVSRVTKKYLMASFLSLFFSIVFQQLFGISRRVANAAYICWILFLGIFSQCAFYFIHCFQKHIFKTDAVYVPYIFEAVSYNGLAFFLLANILTGSINLLINTREVDTLYAYLVVFGYMIVNYLVVGFLYAKSMKFKL